jgi:hypothetical protein
LLGYFDHVALEDSSEELRPFPQDCCVTGPAKRESIVLPILNILAFCHGENIDILKDRPPTPEWTSEPYLDSDASTLATSGPAEAYSFRTYIEGMSVWSNGCVLIEREP